MLLFSVAILSKVNPSAPVVKQTMEPTAPFSLLNSFWQTQLQIIEESELDFKNLEAEEKVGGGEEEGGRGERERKSGAVES